MFRQFSWLVPFSSLKLLVVMMGSSSPTCGRLTGCLKVRVFLASQNLLVVFLLWYVRMVFYVFQWKMAVLNEACVFVGRKLSGILAWLYYYFNCTRRARTELKGRGWDKYKNFCIYLFSDVKGDREFLICEWGRWICSTSGIRTSIFQGMNCGSRK